MRKGKFLVSLSGLFVCISMFVCTSAARAVTVYEDAEDGDTLGWVVYDSNPLGASISNVYDTDRQSRVIVLAGSGTQNGYELRDESGAPWNNGGQFLLEWSMKCSTDVQLYVELQTSAGLRYVYYTAADTDTLGWGPEPLCTMASAPAFVMGSGIPLFEIWRRICNRANPV